MYSLHHVYRRPDVRDGIGWVRRDYHLRHMQHVPDMQQGHVRRQLLTERRHLLALRWGFRNLLQWELRRHSYECQQLRELWKGVLIRLDLLRWHVRRHEHRPKELRLLRHSLRS